MSSPRLHDPAAYRGRVELLPIISDVLSENALGDPHERELPLYLPPGSDQRVNELPVIFVLAGFTGRGQAYLATHPWRRGLAWKIDQAMAGGSCAPAILAFPDCFTRLGGSQYVNSSAVGRYQDHVIEELVPAVDRRLAELGASPAGLAGSAPRRGILGKSSGGIGALHLAMQSPGTFAAAASISGDCCFENNFPPEFLACLRGLVPHRGDPARFLEAFFEQPKLEGDGHAVIITLAMAACYSPNPESPLGFDLPFDLVTGERIEAVWQRWLAFDPLVASEAHVASLRRLRFLHLECGLNDEYHLQWGARRLSRRWQELEIPHRYQEHDGGHHGLDDRYPGLIDAMTRSLTGPGN